MPIKKNENSIFFSVLSIWFLFVFANLLSPFESIHGTYYSIIFFLVFICLFAAGYSLLRKKTKRAEWKTVDLLNYQLIVIILACWLGGFLFFYDKFYIRNYDYAYECLARIRMIWLSDGAQRYGVSSWQNALGYILSFLSFPSYAAMSCKLRKCSFIKKMLFIMASIVPIFVVALLIDSRSIMIFFLVHAVAIFLINIQRWGFKKEFAFEPCFVALFVVSYVLISFQSRANCNFNSGISNSTQSNSAENNKMTKEEFDTDYIDGFQDEIFFKRKNDRAQQVESLAVSMEGVEYTNRFFQKISHSIYLSSVPKSLEMAFMYLQTGFFNFEKTIHSVDNKSKAVFEPLLFSILERMGVEHGKEFGIRRYGKGGIALPGAFYHDYGLWVMLFAGFILGVALALLINIIERLKSSFLSYSMQTLLVVLLVVLFFAPLNFALSLIAAPFVLFAYFLFILLVGINSFFLRE